MSFSIRLRWRPYTLLAPYKYDSKLNLTFQNEILSRCFARYVFHGGLVTYLLVSLGSCGKPIEESVLKAPLQVGKSVVLTHDFGTILANRTSGHIFNIHNDSNVEWSFKRIEVPCSCTVASHDAATIKPGGTAAVSVSYQSKSEVYDDDRSAIVTFNETEAPSIKLRILARVREEITILPKTLEIYCSSQAEQISHFDIFSYSDTDFGLPQIVTDLKNTSIEVSQIPINDRPLVGSQTQNNEQGIRQAWRVLVDARREQAETQVLESRILISLVNSTNAETRQSKVIPLRIRDRGMIRAMPSSMFFGSIKLNTPGEYRVLVRGTRLAEVKEADVTVRHDLGSDFHFEFKRQDEETWLLTTRLKSSKEQLINGTTTIDFGPRLHATLQIPVTAKIE